ncbi:MAG: Panacea domain-containing protein [Bacteroidetes bacterium]|nr:Panacea domain-containing protein [Bacteroidota bacterium]
MKNQDNIKLDGIIAAIVDQMGEVDLYHLNKLTYLFEFLFIKNFGKRYTGELFIKLPHGPVITNYKKVFERLFQAGILETDLEKLKEQRKLSDDYHVKIELKKTEKTTSIIRLDKMIMDFIKKIIIKYGYLSVSDLEKEVYKTKPVKEYQSKVENGFKQQTGSYVLRDCIKLSEYKNTITLGRKLALEHLNKYPDIITKQYQTYEEEFSSLKKLRPAWEN